MSQHNQGVRWVLGALGLLLYMGSLGTGVFIVVKGACNATAQELGALHWYHKIWVLRPSISGILSTVQDSLSVIVICRCHLALQERVAHPNGTIHSAHHPVTSFRAATRHIHNSLIEEFGDLSVSETGASEHHGKDGPSSTAVVGIELEEIRHGREPGGGVDDSSSEVSSCDSIQYPCSGGVDGAGINRGLIGVWGYDTT
ncbi:hypothetical protein JB92DRAFT_3100623 [Gautieria morchelliformis]|nr:hypothetical protein JB92DRAFT_3100623 [Gautieria morchelliformis]